MLARWQEHFSELLNQPLTPPTEELIDRANHTNDCPLCTTDDITPEEVRKALGQLKNARASGICTITAELLKNGGEAVVTWLTKIFNHIWSTEQIPEDWHKGIILPFWKRKGDALTCSNHRGITLLSIPGKHLPGSLSTERSPPCIITADPIRQASCLEINNGSHLRHSIAC